MILHNFIIDYGGTRDGDCLDDEELVFDSFGFAALWDSEEFVRFNRSGAPTDLLGWPVPLDWPSQARGLHDAGRRRTRLTHNLARYPPTLRPIGSSLPYGGAGGL